jgi:putative oxidoreductase
VVFGLLAALSEAVGGLLLILGLFFRVACLLLVGVMIGAMIFHLKRGDGFNMWSHAFEALVVFVSLLFIGPGAYSVDRK